MYLFTEVLEELAYVRRKRNKKKYNKIIGKGNNTSVTVEQTPNFMNDFFHKYRA